jgi:hypothetical protein
MNVRLKHNMSFTAGIYYGGEMTMNHYTVILSMTTNSTDAVSHNVAFERIKYFVYNQLDSTIFINSNLQEKCEQFVSAGLAVTTMPGDPVDQLIGLMLYHKLNAVMEDRIVVDETEISSMLGENIIYLHNGNEYTDIPEFPSWWTTVDPVHSDYVSIEPNKVVSMHANTAWRELDLVWPESQTVTTSGNVVVFSDFKPSNDTK